MIKSIISYLLFPLFYIISNILLELYPNIIFAFFWIASIVGSLVFLIKVPFEKIKCTYKIALFLIAIIPFTDLFFGITKAIKDEIKGEIVLSIMDKSFATNKIITVRKKGEVLNAEFDRSAAGFGDIEKAKAVIVDDSTLLVTLNERKKSFLLRYHGANQMVTEDSSNSKYRILSNRLFK